MGWGEITTEKVYPCEVNIQFGRDRRNMAMTDVANMLNDYIDLDDIHIVWNELSRNFNMFVNLTSDRERRGEL